MVLVCTQFHRHHGGAEPPADGEGACLSNDERADFDGGVEQSQHPVFCGVSRQSGAGAVIEQRSGPGQAVGRLAGGRFSKAARAANGRARRCPECTTVDV